MQTTALTDFTSTDETTPAPEAASSTRAHTPRDGKELIAATRPFASEDRVRSWAHVLETFAVQALALAGAASLPWYGARVVAAVIAGLTIVRSFILFHDYQHGAILRGSLAAKWLFELFGLYVLTPASVWKQTHNYHHAHTAKIVGSHVGSYAMLTVDMWKQLTPAQRLGYRVTRHPLTMLSGYFTIFVWGMCLSPFLRDKKKHWQGPLAVALQVIAAVLITYIWGWQMTLLVQVIPYSVAFALGSYLFYAQHNFPGVRVAPRETWNYTRAALESSSYMECSPIMAWFTGNIGYHHVHHLNPSIPFYRLPEAMAGVPELRDPVKTSLSPRDIAACLRLKLWDPARNEMVPYPD